MSIFDFNDIGKTGHEKTVLVQYTEKELYMRDNDTFINHALYEAVNFFYNFFFSLPFTTIVGYVAYNCFRGGITLSLVVAMLGKVLDEIVGVYPLSFEAWLKKRYEKTKEIIQ